MKKDWGAIYKKYGVVQKEPSPFIIKNLRLLKKRGVKRVLDVGCGTGRNAIFLADNGFGIIGLDPSEEALKIMMELATERGVAAGIVPQKGVQQNLPFDGGSFDAVVAIYTVQHNKFDGAKKTIGEFHRVLRGGGVLIMNVLSTKDHRYGRGEEIEPNTFIKFGEIDDDIPHHFFTRAELKGLLKRFRIIKVAEYMSPAHPPFTPGMWSHWQVIAEKL